jgi:hypothetical protein
MISDVTLVTMNSLPHLFNAFETISHDCGNQAGHYNYAVPGYYAEQELKTFDETLASLSTIDFNDFCIGEDIRMMQIAARSEALTQTSDFLSKFFNGFRA